MTLQTHQDCRCFVGVVKMNSDIIENLFRFPYKLDDFQIKSAKAIVDGKNTLSLGHTGSGKTSVGIIGVSHALKQGQKAISIVQPKLTNKFIFRNEENISKRVHQMKNTF